MKNSSPIKILFILVISNGYDNLILSKIILSNLKFLKNLEKNESSFNYVNNLNIICLYYIFIVFYFHKIFN